MQTGVVKWFNNAKGYGFVLADDQGKDVFAHYSAIEMEGYRTLRAGQCVAFEAIEGPKGLHAVRIKVLEDAPEIGSGTDTSEAAQNIGTEQTEAKTAEPSSS